MKINKNKRKVREKIMNRELEKRVESKGSEFSAQLLKNAGT